MILRHDPPNLDVDFFVDFLFAPQGGHVSKTCGFGTPPQQDHLRRRSPHRDTTSFCQVVKLQSQMFFRATSLVALPVGFVPRFVPPKFRPPAASDFQSLLFSCSRHRYGKVQARGPLHTHLHAVLGIDWRRTTSAAHPPVAGRRGGWHIRCAEGAPMARGGMPFRGKKGPLKRPPGP